MPRRAESEPNPERALSREEILSELHRRCENFTPERELADSDGIYLLEVVSSDGAKRYTYQRARLLPALPGHDVESTTTAIRSEDSDDGYSRTLADYDPKRGIWIDQ